MSDWIRLICILLLKHCQSIHIRSFYVMSSQEVRKLPYTVHKLPGNSSLNVRSLCPVYPVCPGCPCFPVCPDDIMTMTTNANHDHDNNDDHDVHGDHDNHLTMMTLAIVMTMATIMTLLTMMTNPT